MKWNGAGRRKGRLINLVEDSGILWRGRSSVFHVISHEKREETLIDELRFPLDEQFPGMIWTARPFSNSRTNVDAARACVWMDHIYIYIYWRAWNGACYICRFPMYRCPFDVEITSNHDDLDRTIITQLLQKLEFRWFVFNWSE